MGIMATDGGVHTTTATESKNFFRFLILICRWYRSVNGVFPNEIFSLNLPYACSWWRQHTTPKRRCLQRPRQRRIQLPSHCFLIRLEYQLVYLLLCLSKEERVVIRAEGGGGNLKLKSQSAKIWQFHFRGGGIVPRSLIIFICGGRGVFCWNRKVKVPRSLTISFSGGGGYSETEKSKCQDLWQFSFSEGGGVFWNWKVKVPRSLIKNFHFGGGGYSETAFQNRGIL